MARDVNLMSNDIGYVNDRAGESIGGNSTGTTLADTVKNLLNKGSSLYKNLYNKSRTGILNYRIRRAVDKELDSLYGSSADSHSPTMKAATLLTLVPAAFSVINCSSHYVGQQRTTLEQLVQNVDINKKWNTVYKFESPNEGGPVGKVFYFINENINPTEIEDKPAYLDKDSTKSIQDAINSITLSAQIKELVTKDGRFVGYVVANGVADGKVWFNEETGVLSLGVDTQQLEKSGGDGGSGGGGGAGGD